MIKLRNLLGATAAFTVAFGTIAAAQNMPMVGGAPMDPNKPIPVNASAANNLTTLVAAVGQAGLVDTLASDGPFTVFAPVNRAFEKLPAGTVESLMMDENRAMLAGILTYHVVPGRLTKADLVRRMRANNGQVNLTTVEGSPITVRMDGSRLVVIDESGGGAAITQSDVMQSNGVVHVIDSVLMPKS